MSAAEANPAAWFDVLSCQPGAEVHDGWVVTDVPFALCNSVFFPRWSDGSADALVDEVVAAGRARRVPQLWWLGEHTTPVVDRLRARGVVVQVEELPAMALELDALPSVGGHVSVVDDVTLLEEPFCSAFGITDDAWRSLCAAFAAAPVDLRHAVVFEGARVVAAATALVRDGVAGLYDVSVVPDRRGRGLGRAVSVGALAAARDGAGGAGLGVLHATADGLPIYRALGFREVGRVWAAATVIL